MRVAAYVVQWLESKIDTVFTVSGGGAIFLNDAMAQAKSLRYLCNHHEQACAIAAEAYARVTGKIGVAIVTSGPGGTNAITGVAGAWTDHVPMLVISGQAFKRHTISQHQGLRQLGVQEINIIDLVKPITKYAVEVEDARSIQFHLDKAVHLATTGRPGPVWIDIPGDVQNAEMPEALDRFLPTAPTERSIAEEVSRVVEKLVFAKRPLIHIGQGVRIAGAIDELFDFVESFGIPFVTARNANDITPWEHPLYVGRPGTFAQRGANFAVQSSDFYLAIGTRLSLTQTGYNSKDYARNAYVVMVDIDEAELTKPTIRVDLPIQTDAKVFLKELRRQLGNIVGEDDRWGAWRKRCSSWKERYPACLTEYYSEREHVNPYAFIDVLSSFLSESHIIVTDMGVAFQAMHQGFKVKKGQRFFTNCGLASMGWGLPAAIGAFVGSQRPVILVAGDGGLMMNLQELATIAHYRLPVKVFVFNNGGYLTMRQAQQFGFDGRIMGADTNTGLSFPHFRLLAAAHNIPAVQIANHSEFGKLVEFLNSPGPGLCELMLAHDHIQAPRAVNRRNEDGTMNPTPLEDSWPYLPREVIEQEMAL